MKMYVHLRQYLSEFFSEWQIFRIKAVQKIKTHILFLVTFYENRGLYEIKWKNLVETHRPKVTL